MFRRFVIVDEDAALVAELAAMLRVEGSIAETASTFRDAVRLLDMSPAVLVTGLHLGPYNGLHLLVRGRADRPHLRGLIVGPADPVVEREARALGAAAYVPRPVGAAAILEEIHRLPAADDHDEDNEGGTATWSGYGASVS
jgi:ActR/RegA family two-component response regulator